MAEGETVALSGREIVRELIGGETYEYYPIGKYVVRAPEVCRSEPTFKYTRIGVQHALELLSGGRTVEEVANAYDLPVAAVQEAIDLAVRALVEQSG